MVLDNKAISHLEKLRQFIGQSDELLLTSPFLAPEIYALLDGLDVSKSIRKITLITVLEAFDQALDKPPILDNFISYCEWNNISYRLLIDEALHSKVYLFKKNGILRHGVVTSANFTSKGLSENHETGIVVEDSESLSLLETTVQQNCREITANDVQKIAEAAQKHRERFGTKEAQSPRFKAWQYVGGNDDFPHLYPDREYYIKPVGWTKEPYDKHEPIGSKLHFSRKTPHVRVGDILICYAVGPKHLLGYYEILTEPEWDETNERWPWYVVGRCLSPKYSEHFWETGVTLTKAVKSYHQQFPEKPVTARGNTTLGALQWGLDKIKLDGAFADYLISLIRIEHMPEE